MAYRISATTEKDKQLLDAIREMAWQQRIDVSQLMREAFLQKVYGARKNWPEEWQK